MSYMGIKVIYVLATCNWGFKKAVGTLSYLVIFIKT